MGTELERRWRVHGLTLPEQLVEKVRHIEQGYLEVPSPLQSARIRIVDGKVAVGTVKTGTGMERDEIEDFIPMVLARAFMGTCAHRVEKTRYDVNGWEVDVFGGSLKGIVIAEFENTDREQVLRAVPPSWMGEVTEVTDSVTNLHLARLATDLNGSGQDPLPLLDKGVDEKVKSIVLTGPPGSGKSGAINELRPQNPDIQFVPEVATILIRDLGVAPGPDAVSRNRFQRAIYRIQRIFEKTSLEFAAASGKRAVVFDRGTVDSAAYMDGGMKEFEKVFRTIAPAEYRNYDVVLCLAPAPQEVYEVIKANNPARGETYEQAVELGGRIWQVWGLHPCFRYITNGNSWQDKIDAVQRELDRLLRPNTPTC